MESVGNILNLLLSKSSDDTFSQDSNNFYLPMGVEYEFFVFNKDKNPITIADYLNVLEEAKNVSGVLNCEPEVGKNMMEIAFDPVQNLEQYYQILISTFDFFSKNEKTKDWFFLFADNPNFYGISEIPLYLALHKANGFSKASKQLSLYASFQVSFGVEKLGGIFSPKAKKLLYFLNNLAPALSLYFDEWSGVKSARLPNTWVGFESGKKRLPYPLPWNFVNNLKGELQKIPYVVIEEPKGSGNWVPARGRCPEELNPFHCKTIWWYARPSGIGNRGEERVELRSIGTMPPELLSNVLKKLDKLVQYILETSFEEIPLLSYGDWWTVRFKKEGASAIVKAILDKLNIF